MNLDRSFQKKNLNLFYGSSFSLDYCDGGRVRNDYYGSTSNCDGAVTDFAYISDCGSHEGLAYRASCTAPATVSHPLILYAYGGHSCNSEYKYGKVILSEGASQGYTIDAQGKVIAHIDGVDITISSASSCIVSDGGGSYWVSSLPNSKKSMPVGTIAGIAVGVVLGVVLIIFGVAFAMRSGRNSSKVRPRSQPPQYPNYPSQYSGYPAPTAPPSLPHLKLEAA